MTTINISNRVLDSLVQRAYDNFKRDYPEEEPWWRIVCMRKHYRSKYNLTPEDEKKNWRKFIYEDKPNGTISKTIIEDNQPLSLQNKITKVTNKHRVELTSQTGRIKLTPWVKEESKYTTETVHFTQDMMNSMAQSIDVVYRKDEPVDIETTAIDNTMSVWGITSDRFIKPINVDGTKIIDPKDLVNVINELNKSLEEARSELEKYRKLWFDSVRDEEETQKLRIIDKDCDIELKRLNNVIKKDLTIKEVIVKYHQTQAKLNDCKSYTIKKMKDNFDPDEFDVDKKLKEFGFIGTLPRIIDYLISVVKCNDGYESDFD